MKLLTAAFSLILFMVCAALPVYGQVKCIVIDPGHGGKDPGATCGKLQEKNIVLSVALELGALLAKEYPDIKIVYTRKDDRFIELIQRGNIANKAHADLFISIHTNASKNSSAGGTETFVMGVDKSNANLEVAMRENGVIAYESDYTTTYEGYDPSSSESLIIFSLMQYAYLTQSLKLASLVQKEYCNTDKRRDRGVKQAGFLVLWKVATPSILTEIGFISNAEESAYISSTAGQKKIASSIFRAVNEYIDSENSSSAKTLSKEQKTIDKQPETTVNKPITPPAQSARTGISYRMQVKSSPKRIPIIYKNFGAYVTSVQEVKVGNLYKYFCGRVYSYKEALILQSKVRKTFSDAFCVAFDGDEQIAMDKAKKLKP